MGANILAKETVAPVGFLKNYHGWSEHNFTSPPTHGERSDVLDFFLPQWTVVKEQLWQGGDGVWNPVTGTGTPGIFDISRGLLSPSFLVFALTPDHWLGYYFSGLVKLLLAGFGMFLLMRRFVSSPAAFFSGLVFSLGGFNAAWFYWPHVATAAWIPWVLWGVAGWYLEKSYTWLIVVVLTTVMMIAGGFPAVAAYGLYSVLLMSLVFSLRNKLGLKPGFHAASKLVIAIFTAFALLAIPLFGLAEMLSFSYLGPRGGGTAFKFPTDLALLVDPQPEGGHRVEKTLYVGVVALLFTLASLYALVVRGLAHRTEMMAGVAVLLCFLSFGITFGVFPDSLINLIPAVASSTWGRVSVILLLSISILSSIGLDYIYRRYYNVHFSVHRRVGMTVLVAVAVYQVVSQATVFRSFNTVAAASDFFPKTSVLSFVKSNISPFQSVLSDRSFFFDGTLGAYGISEWLAHGHKSTVERNLFSKLIDDPFVTATSASYEYRDLTIDSYFYSRLGIRYILFSNDDLDVLRSVDHKGATALPSMHETELSQILVLNEDARLSGIGLVFGTFENNYFPFDVMVVLNNMKGEAVAVARRPAHEIKDNKNVRFNFQERVDFPAGSYKVRVYFTDLNIKVPLTIWSSPSPEVPGEKICVNDECHAGSMLYTLYKVSNEVDLDDSWRKFDFGDGSISLLENIDTPPGAYFVEELGLESELLTHEIQTKRVSSRRVVIEFSGTTSGFVVVPMRYYPGWNAYVNGKRVNILKYLGVLPSVRVSGQSTIELVYEPWWVNWALAVMFLGFAVLLYFFSKTLPSRKLTKSVD